MSNMSYCRFRNTLDNLRDCGESDDFYEPANLSDEEREARRLMIELMRDLLEDLGATIMDMRHIDY